MTHSGFFLSRIQLLECITHLKLRDGQSVVYKNTQFVRVHFQDELSTVKNIIFKYRLRKKNHFKMFKFCP